MQHAFLVGYLDDDPAEGRAQGDGPAPLRLRLRCVNTRYDRDGNVNTSDTWVTVMLYGRAADAARGTLRRGDAVAVHGRVSLNRFTDRDGRQRQSYAVIAQEIERIEPGGRGGGDAPRERGRERRGYGDGRGGSARGGSSRPAPPTDDFDDDIPW